MRPPFRRIHCDKHIWNRIAYYWILMHLRLYLLYICVFMYGHKFIISRACFNKNKFIYRQYWKTECILKIRPFNQYWFQEMHKSHNIKISKKFECAWIIQKFDALVINLTVLFTVCYLISLSYFTSAIGYVLFQIKKKPLE